MLSKCLIVGNAPAEMIELFGYNPVIEADMNEPAKQIENILNNYDQYIPLIEKNFLHAGKQTWENRWMKILNEIS